MYRFIGPATIFRLPKRMTLVDLSVDEVTSTYYYLAKCLYLSYPDDYVLAELIPGQEYEPHMDVSQADVESHPDRYRKQGVVAGHRDNLADALIVRQKGYLSGA
jgi:hypothetical protein